MHYKFRYFQNCKADRNGFVKSYRLFSPTNHDQIVIYNLTLANLYGDAMSNPLPVGKFQFLSQTETDHFDLMSIPPDSDRRYIIEYNLIYPDHLHPLHSDYPLAPEHLTVNVEMLSPFASQFIDKKWTFSKK